MRISIIDLDPLLLLLLGLFTVSNLVAWYWARRERERAEDLLDEFRTSYQGIIGHLDAFTGFDPGDIFDPETVAHSNRAADRLLRNGIREIIDFNRAAARRSLTPNPEETVTDDRRPTADQ